MTTRHTTPEDPNIKLESARVEPSAQEPANVNLYFAGKPAEEVRAKLREAGFRWHRADKCWYGPREKLAGLGIAG